MDDADKKQADVLRGALFVDHTPNGRGSAPASDGEAGDAELMDLRELDLDMGDLDLTTEEIDMEEVDDDLKLFQQDDIIKEALSKGVDLRHYSRQIQGELASAEASCIGDYLREADNVATLHSQMKECDGVLKRMEDMLGTFQSDLGTISTEIKCLQDKSLSMNVKLKNRSEAEERISDFIAHIDLPEDLVCTIVEGEVNEAFVHSLTVLGERRAFLADPANQTSLPAKDLMPMLERLHLKALQRIRNHLLTRMHALKKPNTNIQIKQKLLVKAQPLYTFMASQQDQEVATEIRKQYVDTMSNIYLSKFKNYLTSMKRLQETSPHKKGDVLGVEETKLQFMFVSGKSAAQISRLFELNQRDSLLSDGQDYIIYHVAAQAGAKFPFERIFRSAQNLLIDTATSEHDFLSAFFGYYRPGVIRSSSSTVASPVLGPGEPPASPTTPTTTPNSPLSPSLTPAAEEETDWTPAELLAAKKASELVKSMFASIFKKTLDLFLEALQEHLADCHDPIGILLMIRVVCQNNRNMQAKRLNCLDYFHDGLNMMLWPRFKTCFNAQLESIKDAKTAAIKKGTVAIHFLIPRYAAFAAAIAKLNTEYKDSILVLGLKDLRERVQQLLEVCVQKVVVPRQQTIFLINNYNHILHTFKSKNLAIADHADWAYFDTRCQMKVRVYVEEELQQKFSRLVALVKESSGAEEEPDAEVMSSIVRLFARSWRDGIESINASVQQNFAVADAGGGGSGPASEGQEILKQVLIQLVLYYQRFQDLLKKHKAGTSLAKELVPIPTIMYEIKKYGQAGGASSTSSR